MKHNQTPQDPANPEVADGRQSRLASLLQLGAHHAGGHEYTSTERTYLQGWKHCLMALQGNISSQSPNIPFTTNGNFNIIF